MRIIRRFPTALAIGAAVGLVSYCLVVTFAPEWGAYRWKAISP